MVAFPLAAGDIVAGKFVVERTIGAGGMGQVVAARHQQLGTTVAIKVIHANEAKDPHAVTRFRREALAIARLRSEHVVRIYDIGETESGAPFMIMEYLEGHDLGALLLERGPLPIADALAYVFQACDALIEAHDAGIYHRDIKPQNLFLAKRPSGESTIRVLDFGLAKGDAFHSELKLTAPGDIVGTARYMAPEQILGGAIDARTDIWGLGVSLYRLLTRSYPFASGNAPDILASILTHEPIALREQRPEIPPRLEAVVSRCLRRDPSERFPNMRELADALRSCVANERDTERSVPTVPEVMSLANMDTLREAPRVLAAAQPTPHAAIPGVLAPTLAVRERPVELATAKPAGAAATLAVGQAPFAIEQTTLPRINPGVTLPLRTIPRLSPIEGDVRAPARTAAPDRLPPRNALAVVAATAAAIVLVVVVAYVMVARRRTTAAAAFASPSSSSSFSTLASSSAPPTSTSLPSIASASSAVATPSAASAPLQPVTSGPARTHSASAPKTAATAPATSTSSKKAGAKGDDPYESL
jgi:serine/threonine-protein kinase